jgi:enoyl-CoA hydratase
MTSSDQAPVLHAELDDGVLMLTLNRPEARNALSPGLVAALNEALTRFEDNHAVKVGVMTGVGRAFCSGLDLKVFATADADRATVSALIHRVGRTAKPLIGAINGPAVTGGLELALGCDFLIGSTHAMFADTHATIGAFPGGGMTARLGRVLGARSAKAMTLAGVRLDAEAALRAGLLTEIVEPDALVARALELAQNVAAANQDFVRNVRVLYDENADRSLPEALAAERAAHQRWRDNQPLQWSV